MGVDYFDCPNCGESTNDHLANPRFEIIELEETMQTCERCCEEFKRQLDPEYDTDGELIGYHVTRQFLEEQIGDCEAKIRDTQQTIKRYQEALPKADAWEKEQKEKEEAGDSEDEEESDTADKKKEAPKRKAADDSKSGAEEPPAKKQRV